MGLCDLLLILTGEVIFTVNHKVELEVDKTLIAIMKSNSIPNTNPIDLTVRKRQKLLDIVPFGYIQDI